MLITVFALCTPFVSHTPNADGHEDNSKTDGADGAMKGPRTRHKDFITVA
jgi:hypothetical protein